MQSFDAEKRRDQARSFALMSFRAGCVSDGWLSGLLSESDAKTQRSQRKTINPDLSGAS